MPRRRFLQIAAAVPVTVLHAGPPGRSAADGLSGLPVHPRSDWAGRRLPAAPMPSERSGDVRFLLVHHSVSPNDHTADDVPDLIRGFRDAHVAKGWPDVAYNFFVDRLGGIWEGRAGSLDGPVVADATGGNQGFSQLCCLIGDFRAQPPSEPAVDALVLVLAALADRYDIDTGAGARAEFVSRGSNRWPRGTAVTTPTIAGHRDMSRTECPGDACYALIRGPIRERVDATRAEAPAFPPAAVGPAPVPPGGSPTAGSGDGGGTGAGATAAAIGVGSAAVVGGAAAWAICRRSRGTVRPPDRAVPHDRNRVRDER